jgi:hypothetical protein
VDWPATGAARFDQKAIESSAWQGWTANLKRRGIRVVQNRELEAGNPATYAPGSGILEYNPETFRYIDLLHESRHVAQFDRAAARGLDLQAPFGSRRLLGWLEKGALDFETRLGLHFGFSQDYMHAIEKSRSLAWRRSYQFKYRQSSSFRAKLDAWWN